MQATKRKAESAWGSNSAKRPQPAGSSRPSSSHHSSSHSHSSSKPRSWLFSENSFVSRTPSRTQLKMSLSQELKARESIHDFIIKLASKLKLDGPTILAATVYVNRFYMRMPITSSKYYVASAAVAISCKLNDTYRVPDKIALNACNLKNPTPAIPIDEQSDMFWRWRDQLLYREELILKTINFDLNIDLPYEIRDELLASSDEDPESTFGKKKADILKNTVSLLEVVSSLPVLVCFDIYTLFGTLMVVVILEGRVKFEDESLILPQNYMIRNLGVEMSSCWSCYKYIIKLLKACEEDPAVISNKIAGKRLREITEEVFTGTMENYSNEVSSNKEAKLDTSADDNSLESAAKARQSSPSTSNGTEKEEKGATFEKPSDDQNS